MSAIAGVAANIAMVALMLALARREILIVILIGPITACGQQQPLRLA